MCVNISLLLGDVKILDHIQLAFHAGRENIDFMQIDLKKKNKKQE